MFLGRRCRCSINQKPRYVSVLLSDWKSPQTLGCVTMKWFGFHDNLWILSSGPPEMKRSRRRTWLSPWVRRVRFKLCQLPHLWLTPWHTSIIEFSFGRAHSTGEEGGLTQCSHMLNGWMCNTSPVSCKERNRQIDLIEDTVSVSCFTLIRREKYKCAWRRSTNRGR